MKTSYKVTFLAILLAIFASSCTKEITSPNTIANGTSYSATYTVNSWLSPKRATPSAFGLTATLETPSPPKKFLLSTPPIKN